ncbi:MAG: hypothetical protein AVDCRST_MAG28-3455 [uncultured Rubrobacteraceae bacterium]|uniref:Uncharacterized protein n=1 Tax=uncultured Rubrobacteraceae bacterium TaxID=349277 RepID=A0A6J4RCM8_9ACTN|nr:MAG: hypothetical protein AVDCRST_MAG28-3455 [uncultured Rubrobacteraceae bacterium]
MNYGDLIKDAFWLTLRNRYLWFFGFFAGGTSTGVTNFNIPSGGPGGFDDEDFGEPGGGDFRSQVSGQGFDPGQLMSDNLILILGIITLIVLVVLFFIVMTLISQGALAESVAAIDRNESRRFSSAFRAGVSNFWRVLGYYLLFILIVLGLLLSIGIPIALLVVGVFAGTESTGARIATAVLAGLTVIVILIVVFIPLSIIGQFALREIVVGRTGVVGSVGSGYRLFRRNLGRSLLVWLIQVALSIGAGIVLLIVLLILGFILFLPTIILAVAGYATAAIVAGIVAALILLPILIVASGALGTFSHSYWTLAYLRLVSPIERATVQEV